MLTKRCWRAFNQSIILRPLFQVHLGSRGALTYRDLLEQPLDFDEPDVLLPLNL